MSAPSSQCRNQYWDKGKTEMADHKPWPVFAGVPVLACSSDLTTQSQEKTFDMKPFQPLLTAGGDGTNQKSNRKKSCTPEKIVTSRQRHRDPFVAKKFIPLGSEQGCRTDRLSLAPESAECIGTDVLRCAHCVLPQYQEDTAFDGF